MDLTDAPSTARALWHNAGQTWDATAAVQATYQADTGDSSHPLIPTWDGLTDVQRVMFVALIGDIWNRTLVIAESIIRATPTLRDTHP